VKSVPSLILAKIALGAVSSTVALGVLLPSSAHALTLVDTELFLSIDSSSSVSASEFDLQKTAMSMPSKMPRFRARLSVCRKGWRLHSATGLVAIIRT
jgi:hypothetical protein